MIWIMISILTLVIGIALLVLYNEWWDAPELFEIAGLFATIVGVVATVITVIMVILNFALTDIGYQDAVAERQMLEYRIEHCENLVGNELIYSDIVGFNEGLRHTKRFANSPWTNWFYNKKIAEMDYIDIIEPVKGETDQ